MHVELDPTLFRPESAERLEAEVLAMANMVMSTDEQLALTNLFTILGGWADHLKTGMTSVGFDEREAGIESWQVVWSRLRTLLDTETRFTAELAAYIERSFGVLTPPYEMTDSGEPLDPMPRTFYRTFLNCLEHPAIHPTAKWLYETS